MPLHPLGSKLLVELEPESRMIGSFIMPDMDRLRYCAKCHNYMEALDDREPCRGVDQFEHDKLRDRINFTGTDFSHDVKWIEQPITGSRVRFGEVLLVGPRVSEVRVGDRVAIDRLAGGTEDAVRMVRESEVLAVVEG